MLIFVLQFRIESHGSLLLETFPDDILKIRECSSADEKNILCIHSGQRYHGIFTVGPHRHFHLTALKKFQHSLLNGLAAHIPLIGISFLRDLVDLINKDNPLFGALHIIVGRGKKF